MIISNQTSKSVPWYLKILRNLLSLAKFSIKPIPVKFPFKYFIITVISTILIWTLIASAIIYRNAYKADIGGLADILEFQGRREKHKLGKAIKAFLFAPVNWLSANFLPEDIPHIYIDLKFKHYQKIVKKREEALSRGFLRSGSDDYVPAVIKYQKKSLKVKLRLKGDFSPHWSGDKWSFRIHTKKNHHLFGMRAFSIQNAKERGYESAIIFFEALRREGVLTPRYFFVNLTVNGKNIGIMALEEHFSKELLESQGRKESVILKYDESIWMNNTVFREPFNNFRTNLIEPFRKRTVLNNKRLTKDWGIATSLLRGFGNGTLTASQVFDAELWGKYYAVASVWGGMHSIVWRNIRFYYNPITGKLEPIAYDEQLHYFKRRPMEPTSKKTLFPAAIIQSDPELKSFYEATLSKLEKEAREGITEEWVRPIQNRNLRILHKEYPLLGGVNLFGMVESVSASLARSRDHYNYQSILRAYLIKDKAGDYLEIHSPLPHSVIISSIDLIGENGEGIKFDTTSPLKLPLKLLPTPLKTIPRILKIFYSLPEKTKNYKLIISANIDGDSKKWTIEASKYFPIAEENHVPSSTLGQVLGDHPFLSHISGTTSLTIKQGIWKIDDSLVVPKGMTLVIQKGTTLKFDSESALIAKGPILIEGTKDSPVLLEGQGDSGEKQSWQGIVVLNSLKTSIWSHVQIKNTTGIRKNGWTLSGGVNFYKSDIKMDHVILSGNRAEDALNVVRSNFKLKNVTIKNTTSDAFDSDFSKGTVVGGIFENIGSQGGGDGIDVSGSEVTVTNSSFENISDKGISVGENSNMRANEINIKATDIGVASKDGSRLFLSNSILTGIKQAGLMAYIKKGEYGPAEIIAKNLKFNSTDQHAVVQKENKISIDGIEVLPTDLDVEKLYSTSDNL